MKLKELTALMSCKDGYELFKKVADILNGLGVRVYDESGLVARDLYAVCCDVAEVLNKEK